MLARSTPDDRALVAAIGARNGHQHPAGLDLAAAPAVAYVSAGRWVADCPWCPSAQMVHEDHPTFWCCECGNPDCAGLDRQLVFPDDAHLIERALLVRPRENRHARPSEPLEQLHGENAAHDLEAFGWTPPEPIHMLPTIEAT